MNISLSDHFDYKRLLRFTFPSIVMMVFSSIYYVVDGYFVSNFAGKTAFAALNLIMPFLMILGTIGFMFGTGGSALVARAMGEGEPDEANRRFSLLIYVSVVLGVVLAAAGIVFMRPVAILIGADEYMVAPCVLYGSIVCAGLPAFILQMEFQTFCITAEKPKLGLRITVAAGVANMILDALFIGVFRWGLAGAAAASVIGQMIGGFVPLLYFARRNSSRLRLVRTRWDGKTIVRACTNGVSEMLTNLSMSFVSMLYNLQLMKYAGEDGIAAYGVLMYVAFIFVAVFIGYSVGIAPVVSFHFGAGDKDELKNILRRSTVIIGISALAMFAAGELLSGALSKIFVGYSEELYLMTKHAFEVYSFSFLLTGFAIYASSFFTALNDGVTSGIISFLRSLLFQGTAVLLLPVFMGIEGVWLSVPAAEVLSVLAAVSFLYAKRGKYGYM